MTVHHREPPPVRPAKRARPVAAHRLAAGLRHADRPWSIGVDILLLILIVAVMCWEVWEFALDTEVPHLLAACACLVGAVLHMFRTLADPSDRPENDR